MNQPSISCKQGHVIIFRPVPGSVRFSSGFGIHRRKKKVPKWCPALSQQRHNFFVLYRVAQKECNTYDQYFQENEGQNEQVVCITAYKILFPVR